MPFCIVAWLLFFLFGMLDGVWNLVLGFVRWAAKHFANEDFDVEIPSIVASSALILLILAVIFFIGYRFEKRQNVIFVKLGEWIISKIPLLGSVYYTIKDLTNMLSGESKDKYLGVAFVELGGGEIMGFITREEGEYFWVFCPLTPPTSGLLLRIHKDKIKKSNMSVSDGLKKLVSFGMK
nr:DUF502 domain-containing protein [Helicobacter saguini]